MVPVPGPSAVLAALVASGLPTAEFMFVGFLPAKPAARLQKLRQVAGKRSTRSSVRDPPCELGSSPDQAHSDSCLLAP